MTKTKKTQSTQNSTKIHEASESFKLKLRNLAEEARKDTYLTEQATQELRSWICEDSVFVADIMRASEHIARTDGCPGLWIRFEKGIISEKWEYRLSDSRYGGNYKLTKLISNDELIPIIDNFKRSKRIRAYFCKLLTDLLGITTISISDNVLFLDWEH